MIRLCSGSVYMSFPDSRLFLYIRSGIDSMRTSVITNPVIDCRVVMNDDCIVNIYIMNNCTIYIDDGRIIPE